MDAIDMKTMQNIKDYRNSLDKPDNVIYQEHSLLIDSCFAKSIEILEETSKLRDVIKPSLCQRITNFIKTYTFLNHQ